MKDIHRRSIGVNVPRGPGGGEVAKGDNLSSSSVGRSCPLKVVLGVESEEEMVLSSCSSPNPNLFRDSVATVAMVTSASDSFSFPEKDSLYTSY